MENVDQLRAELLADVETKVALAHRRNMLREATGLPEQDLTCCTILVDETLWHKHVVTYRTDTVTDAIRFMDHLHDRFGFLPISVRTNGCTVIRETAAFSGSDKTAYTYPADSEVYATGDGGCIVSYDRSLAGDARAEISAYIDIPDFGPVYVATRVSYGQWRTAFGALYAGTIRPTPDTCAYVPLHATATVCPFSFSRVDSRGVDIRNVCATYSDLAAYFPHE